MKISRPLSILLCFIVLISSFTVTVNGADDENLINPDITTWEKINDANNVTMASGGGYQSITIRPIYADVNYSYPIGGVYDLSEESVKVGDIYRLSLEFLNGDQFLGASAGLVSSKAFLDYNAHLYIGLASYVGGGPEIIDNCYVDITKSNYNDYANKTLNLSFEMPSGVVNPCIVIYLECSLPDSSVDRSVYLVFKNISFVNETDEEEKSSFDGFFTKLGNLILYASWSEEPPENPFKLEDKPMSSLATRLMAISDSFASSGENFENVIDSITGSVYVLEELVNFEFTFEKEVNGSVEYITLDFGWLFGILVFTLAVIVIARFIGL